MNFNSHIQKAEKLLGSHLNVAFVQLILIQFHSKQDDITSANNSLCLLKSLVLGIYFFENLRNETRSLMNFKMLSYLLYFLHVLLEIKVKSEKHTLHVKFANVQCYIAYFLV